MPLTRRRAGRAAARDRARDPGRARRPRRLGAGRHDARASTAATWPPTRPALARARARPASGVLSEESGLHGADRRRRGRRRPARRHHQRRPGASRGSPPACAPSTPTGPRAALVVDLPHGRTFTAVRGGGAAVDGVPLAPSGCTEPAEALVGISGLPRELARLAAVPRAGRRRPRPVRGGRGHARRLTSTAARPPTAPWDYLGGALVCPEAGARRRRRARAATSWRSTTAPAGRRWRRPRRRCSRRCWRPGPDTTPSMSSDRDATVAAVSRAVGSLNPW